MHFVLQEGGSLNLVDLHQLFTTLRHGLIILFPRYQPVVEVLQLRVLRLHILHIRKRHLRALGHFLLRVAAENARGFLVVVHGCAHFVLRLQMLDFGISTPDHHLDA